MPKARPYRPRSSRRPTNGDPKESGPERRYPKKEKNMKKTALLAFLMFLAASAFTSVGAPGQAAVSISELEKSVLTALWKLPHYGVFDSLAFKIEGSTVTLIGQVLMPITKEDAARRVKQIQGIQNVVNNIEVLPLSENDDSIRIRAYRAIFGTADLYRYAMGADPTIHIIVKNGRIMLEGVVSSKQDVDLALLAARGIPGIFGASSNLKIQK
jgi:hyperosmotically inducible protein